ncbi:MAG: hypothetical protein ACK2VD_00330 [Anaerolineae bacterium]
MRHKGSSSVCLSGLLYLQLRVFVPRGLQIDLLNPLPWLFTLPIPVAVFLASGATVARMLGRLDPVSIVERRT